MGIRKDFIDLSGSTINNLTVLSYEGKEVYLCLCSCGLETKVSSAILHRKRKGAFGCIPCLRLEQAQRGRTQLSSKAVDLTGKKFGNYLVLGLSDKTFTIKATSKRKSQEIPRWEVVCDCGVHSFLTAGNIVAALTKHCKSCKPSPVSKGGVTPLRDQIRHSVEYGDWRKAVFERDSYTCQICKKKGSRLRAHHIIYFSTILDSFNITSIELAKSCGFLWDLSNGLTLCEPCHRGVHKGTRACPGTIETFPGFDRTKFKTFSPPEQAFYFRDLLFTSPSMNSTYIYSFLCCNNIRELRMMYILYARGDFSQLDKK